MFRQIKAERVSWMATHTKLRWSFGQTRHLSSWHKFKIRKFGTGSGNLSSYMTTDLESEPYQEIRPRTISPIPYQRFVKPSQNLREIVERKAKVHKWCDSLKIVTGIGQIWLATTPTRPAISTVGIVSTRLMPVPVRAVLYECLARPVEHKRNLCWIHFEFCATEYPSSYFGFGVYHTNDNQQTTLNIVATPRSIQIELHCSLVMRATTVFSNACLITHFV